MLLVETYISISSGKGIGLFAKDKIPKGTKYWVRNETFDKVISQTQLNTFNKLASNYIKTYGFQEINFNWYLCGDNARFSNHSIVPNSQNHFDVNGFLQYHSASDEIKPGEEIFCDYREICLTCSNGIEFNEKNQPISGCFSMSP
jgi:SET domain-containing protein